MSDTILTQDVVASRILFDLFNDLGFTRQVFRGFNTEFQTAIGGYKKGDSVRVQLPSRSRTVDGPDITSAIVDENELNTTVTLDEHKVTPFDFTAQQLTLDIEDFSRKYIKHRTISHANIVDALGTAEYVNIYNQVGTPGTTPSTYSFLTGVANRMDNESVPQMDRKGILSSNAIWSMADGELKSVFDQSNVRKLTERGFQGTTYANMDLFMDVNIKSHTTGNQAARADGSSTVQVKVQPSEGDSEIQLKGLTASTGTILAGDILTLATVAGVNPISGDAWEGNELRQFVATANAAADGSGDATVSVSPDIISSAATSKILPDQTVNDIPLVNDNVTIVGAASTAYPQHLFFNPECFAMTMVPFARPDSADQSVKWATASDDQLGLSITLASAFNILTYLEFYRLDTLFGWDTPRPNLGVRGTG